MSRVPDFVLSCARLAALTGQNCAALPGGGVPGVSSRSRAGGRRRGSCSPSASRAAIEDLGNGRPDADAAQWPGRSGRVAGPSGQTQGIAQLTIVASAPSPSRRRWSRCDRGDRNVPPWTSRRAARGRGGEAPSTSSSRGRSTPQWSETRGLARPHRRLVAVRGKGGVAVNLGPTHRLSNPPDCDWGPPEGVINGRGPNATAPFRRYLPRPFSPGSA